jgi:hypothetical protein
MDDGEPDAPGEADRLGEPRLGRAGRASRRMAVRRRAPAPLVGQDDRGEGRAGVGAAAAVVRRGRRVWVSFLWQG